MKHGCTAATSATSPVDSDRLTGAVERLAQRAYDLRDSVPASDLWGWSELDAVARRLSKLVARRQRMSGIKTKAKARR